MKRPARRSRWQDRGRGYEVGRGEYLIVSEEAQTRMVSEVRIRRDSWKFCGLSKGIICDDISEIAVGTLITERPPHRTERAPLGHSAPTSGI